MSPNFFGWFLYALFPWYTFAGLYMLNADYAQKFFSLEGPAAWYGFGMLIAVLIVTAFTTMVGVNRAPGTFSFFVAVILATLLNAVGIAIIVLGPAVMTMVEQFTPAHNP